MLRRKPTLRSRILAVTASVLLLPQLLVVTGVYAAGGDDTPFLKPGTHAPELNEEDEERLLALDLSFISNRLAGDRPLTISQAGQLRSAAAHQAQVIRKQGLPAAGPTTFTGAWAGIGPNPVVQGLRSPDPFGQRYGAMAGRIGALAIRPSNGQFILGGAQGGIWLYDAGTGKWSSKTDDLPSLAIGALAIAPSNDAIVYAGTGEGALSGDSYFGNGILKSTDGGNTWSHVSGDYFIAVSVSRLVVDPNNANHLYAAIIRGRGGKQRTTPSIHSKFGIWESKDGAATWTLLKEAKSENNGATDLEIDPQNPNVLYASFWQDAIYKSIDGGQSWAPIMTGLPPVSGSGLAATRYSISISHPAGQSAVLYAGFPSLHDGANVSTVWKSTNDGGSWSELPTGTGADSVLDYCGGQCSYDNVIEADPTNPDVVFAAGQFNYGIGSGGIFRSDDGGLTWKNLGYDQHPDFHALAFNPANTQQVIEGNDGGVWVSDDQGGRPDASDPLNAVTWFSLDGNIADVDLFDDSDPPNVIATGPYAPIVGFRSNLQIGQFTSIAIDPTTAPGADGLRIWGGTQDNGTLRKSVNSATWFDVASGDGGQVLVDPTDGHYVYGTYFGISPYRYTNGGASFFSNQGITNGINVSDRSEFYVPFTLNRDDPNQLFLGTFRLYRTNTAKAATAGAVKWNAISPDLTTGCGGAAPNGARGCLLSAIGVGGGNAVYVGTDDGLLWVAPNGQTAKSPTWVRLDKNGLPRRPIASIAVDRSNWRIAYVAYNGFSPATPGAPGHLFKTTDGGDHWTNVSGNLPDSPLNSIILDPSFPNTLYAGTDVGPFVTYDGGFHWNALGTGFPIVGIWQMDLDPSHRLLAAGTHGRGAFRISDGATVPAFVVSKVDAGIPVGSGSNLDYTITLRNIGNAGATGVTVTDPIPANTSFVSAGESGTGSNGKVSWSGLTLAAGASIDLHFRVSIAQALKKHVAAITNDGIVVTSAEGPGTTGSATVTSIATPYAAEISPATVTGVAHAGDSVSYTLAVRNLGSNTDSFNLSTTGTFGAALFASDCTTASTSTASLAPGDSADVCVTITVPGGASQGDTDNTTLTATSAGGPTASASATITTSAVTVDTLLVDGDGNIPNVQASYSAALTAAGVGFGTWDLAADPAPPVGIFQAYKNIVWFTGNSYPGPIGPYEGDLASFLDSGGRLLMSGQDILDQAAGTTAFVHDYLHIDWDGTEAQNDKSTAAVHGVAATLSAGLGAIPIDHSVLGAAFEDRITPNGTAVGNFTDDSTAFDGLQVDTGTYKVVFLAFPLEAYGTAGDKADLVTRVFTFFGP